MEEDELDEIMNRPDVKAVMDALAAYDNRYIGNVPKEKAIEAGLFTESEIQDY